MRLFTSLLLLALPVAASAVPTEMNHQGRLFDALGTPVDAPTDLTFSLYDAASGGTALWTEDQTGVSFDNGYFSVQLGSNSALDSAIFDGDALYLGISVGGGPELSPRPKLASVSYAFRADNADTAAALAPGADINVNSLQVNGTTVVDSSGGISGPVDWANLTGVPSDLSDGDGDSLAAITGCADGDVAIYGGGSWSCSGTIGLDRLAVGTSANTVAFGDHTHSYGFTDIGGTVSLSQLPMGGTGSTGVAYADHDHGDIQPGDNTATCDDSTASLWGTLRWTGTALDVCTATGWKTIESNAPTGSGPLDAGLTCKTLLDDNGTLNSGVFWLDPDGPGGNAPFETYCDMDTDGGGWTLASYGHLASTATDSGNANNRSLMCGGGAFDPVNRAGSGATINAVALAQQSTHMAISMNTGGVPQTAGRISDYQRGYKIAIPDPSAVNFISHSRQGPTWGTGTDEAGACTPTAASGIHGSTYSGTLYLTAHSLGTSWGDSYPTGYGAMADSDCLNTASGIFAPSFHSGHGHTGTYGTHIDECDVTHGSLNYVHQGQWNPDDGAGQTGANAIWFR